MDVIRGELTVTVVSGRDLPAGDSNGKSDPYVQLRVGKGAVRKTRAVRSTLDPQWREMFTFRVEDCLRQTLFAEVWDKDSFSSDDYLGEVKFHTRSLIAAPRAAAWFSLQHKAGKHVPGQIFLDLAFSPDGGIAALAQLQQGGPAPPPGYANHNNSNSNQQHQGGHHQGGSSGKIGSAYVIDSFLLRVRENPKEEEGGGENFSFSFLFSL